MRVLSGLITVIFLLSTSVWAEEVLNVIKYDKQKDTLSMNVDKVSLKWILATIAMQSHVEVLFDDRADQPVTLSLENRPLQDGLKDLLRGSSYVFRYTRDSNDKVLLIGVSVLPDGDVADANAQPLLHVAGETFMHTKKNHLLSAEELSRQEVYNERWQARLAEMPAAVREKVVQHAKERVEAQDKKRAEKAARKEEKKAKRESRKVEREAERQQWLEGLSPEERALREQRRVKVEQMVTGQ